MPLPRAPRSRARHAAPLIAAGALALVTATVPTAAAAAPLAYFSIGPNVYRAVLDGSSPAQYVTGTTDSLFFRGIALDPARGRFFTSRASNPGIEFAPLAPGGSLAAVAVGFPGHHNPGGISIDPAAGKLYWGTEGGGTNGNLLEATMTGAGTSVIGTPGTNNKRVLGLAVDPSTRTIWWAEYGSSPAINWTRTDGSARGTLDTTGASLNAPSAIAISHRTSRAYWANFWNIGSASLAGGSGSDIPTAMAPGGVAIDDAAGHLYWMETVGYPGVVGVRRAGLDGQGAVSVTPPNLPAGSASALALLMAPVKASGPAVMGTAVVGNDLTCTAATWAADTPESYAFRAPELTSVQWTLDGQTIDGATAMVHRATTPGRYACVSVAANVAGMTSAPSDGIGVVAAASPDGGGAAGGGTTSPRALRAVWTARGGRVATAFTAPARSTRFSITAQPATTRTQAAHAEAARPRTGRCSAKGPRARRTITCAITLPKGRWSVSTTAWTGSVATARTTRTIRVR